MSLDTNELEVKTHQLTEAIGLSQLVQHLSLESYCGAGGI